MLFTIPLLADFKENSTVLFSSFKKPYTKIRETRKLGSIHELHFVEWKDEDRKPDKNSSLRDSSLCPETSTKNTFQEFHLCSTRLYGCLGP